MRVLWKKLERLLRRRGKNIEIWFVKEKKKHKKRLLQTFKCRAQIKLHILELWIQHHFKYDSDFPSHYNLGRRIKTRLCTSTCTRSDIEKRLCFFWERKISRPLAKLEAMDWWIQRMRMMTTSAFFKNLVGGVSQYLLNQGKDHLCKNGREKCSNR